MRFFYINSVINSFILFILILSTNIVKLHPFKSGLIPDFDFIYELRTPVDGFADNFTVNLTVLSQSIYTTFFKLDGFIAKASSRSLIKNDICLEI